MRRWMGTVLVVLAGTLASAPAVDAHPLGNFTVNHLSEVRVSDDRVDVRYTLDQAEIPTVRERGKPPAAVLAAKRAEVERGLTLTVDGRRVPLRLEPGGRVVFPPGQGGLRTTRVEIALSARVDGPRQVELRDSTFADRVGWKAIVARPGEGTAVRSSVPSEDVTGGLRAYPAQLLKSPLDQRAASFSVERGDGTVTAPRAEGGGQQTTGERSSGDGFAGLFADAAAGQGVLFLLLAAAFGWGAVHALSPGHGKAMVAAYLVGTRGSARDAIVLGATVTVTHTIGVLALGAVTLALSQYLLPEDLYPWLTLVSGLLVVLVGAGVLRSRLRLARRSAATAVAHDHHHGHGHDHGDGHHHHHPPEGGWKGLIAMGASAGLIPCPSALVVLLGAIAQHQLLLGMLMIVVFSIGLAAALTALGLAVVYAGRLTQRVNVTGRVARSLPALSAVAIVVVGCVLTVQAVPQVL